MMGALSGDEGLTAALAGVGRSEITDEDLARVAWSVITEPGDGVAGVLIAELGAAEALRFALRPGSTLPALTADRRALREGMRRWRARADPLAVRAAVTGAQHVGARLILPGDASWPEQLDDLGAHRPLVLWVRGDVALLRRGPRVAMVGARAASGYGELLAAEFAGDLAASGAVVVSGGA